MMKLRRDKTPGAHAVSVLCGGENHYETDPRVFGRTRMFTLADGSLDPKGPAFQAYYCPHCTAKLLADGAAVIEGEYRSEHGGSTKFFPAEGSA